MTPNSTPGPPAVNKWLVTIAVMAGTFMEIIDTTIVNVALPQMSGSLSAGVDEATWVLTMTRSHQCEVLRLVPEARERVFLLKYFPPGEGGAGPEHDVGDPLGGSEEVYEEVARELEQAVRRVAGYLAEQDC